MISPVRWKNRNDCNSPAKVITRLERLRQIFKHEKVREGQRQIAYRYKPISLSGTAFRMFYYLQIVRKWTGAIHPMVSVHVIMQQVSDGGAKVK